MIFQSRIYQVLAALPEKEVVLVLDPLFCEHELDSIRFLYS